MWREPGDCALEPRERYGGAKSLTTSVKRAAGLRVAPGADDAEVSCLVSKSFGQSDREPELPRHFVPSRMANINWNARGR